MSKISKKLDLRDVSPVLQMIRNFLLGRKHTLAVRFEHEMVTRSGAPPNLPGGPAHQLNDNAYCLRDARREIKPPTVLKSQNQIADGCDKLKIPTPGRVHIWD